MAKLHPADMVVAFGGGPDKEPPGPSIVCRRLAGLLKVPADKIDEFEHLLGAYMDEREAKEGEQEEGGEGEGDEKGDGY